jgi:hypothetical protein
MIFMPNDEKLEAASKAIFEKVSSVKPMHVPQYQDQDRNSQILNPKISDEHGLHQLCLNPARWPVRRG